MIVVAGTIKIDPANTDAAKAAMTKLMAATIEEAGCQAYRFTLDLEEPGAFHVFEKWDDEAALNAHMGMPHMAEFIGALGGLGVTGTDVLRYEVSGSSKLF